MINPNFAFEEELFFRYLRDPESVSPEWRSYFQKNYPDNKKSFIEFKQDNIQTDSNTSGDLNSAETTDGKIPLSSIQSRIADNMNSSLEIPTATSVRTIPVKALDENRRIIKKYLLRQKRKKVSFTHILSWAIVRTLVKFPHMNDSFEVIDGKPYRIKKSSINLGLAIDITKKDNTRMLYVPSIKNCQNMTFPEFIDAYDDLVNKTRNNQLSIEDLSGATITLTNPGMIGTTASNPRLMSGQGLIIAAGVIDYPTEFQAVRSDVLAKLAISKTVTITNTYDHRIIQGAESAEFLAYLNELLIGKRHFYDQIFASLRIPFEPIRWETDDSKLSRYGQLDEREIIEKGAHVSLLINAYRVRGHLLASVNPLGLSTYYYPELDPAHYGFTIWDMDRVFHADDSWEKNNLPLRDIIEILRDTYCGNISIEFMHIQDPSKKQWVKENLEIRRSTLEYTTEEKNNILTKLIEAEEFENFLHTKFIGHKRFSLEGSESLIVLLDRLFNSAASDSLNSIVLGMAHRGRLNTLVNIIGKSLEKIFKEFEGEFDPDTFHGSGDVKYHLGDRGSYKTENGNSVDVILAPNPSHLELVNPIIEGMTRALSTAIQDKSRMKNMPVLIHGDAAFAGQGIVAETLNISQLTGYKTGGTIHIIINNQIGFTTNAQDARSTVYATDVAKMIQVPIIHVNGNDPEAVASAAIFAFEYRKNFGDDIIIDLLCYRKYGHNEGDEPSYTQPLLYKKIKSMPPISKIYSDELILQGYMEEEQYLDITRTVQTTLQNAFINRSVKEVVSKAKRKSTVLVKKIEDVETKYPEDKLKLIAQKISSVPDNFNLNPKLKNLLSKRAKMVDSTTPAIDWALAEALSFGSLLLDGIMIRFTGQDSRRGTFSQRHSVLIDSATEEHYISLNHIQAGQEMLRIYDSPLSELSILGFEYGFSVLSHNSLVLWEAQFGDFTNMAQAMIDQIIVCAESKWGQTSNLTMLLPHSYDGQGPEHSSARLERFLQLAAEDNIIVCNLTTPANYFHVLRRQALNRNRKPLIIMTPKSMLRHPMAVSSIKDLSDINFMPIIDDYDINKSDVDTVVFTSGKIFYELKDERQKRDLKNFALIRIEQLYPLNQKAIERIIKSYPIATKLVWVQEEPKNMGGWNYIFENFSQFLSSKQKLSYIGRKAGASTATGSALVHQLEQEQIYNDLFSV